MIPATTLLTGFRAALRLGVCALLLTVSAPSQAWADVGTKAGEKPKDRKDDKKKEFDFLPEARNVTARFVAGQKVDIELVASVGSLKQMEFAVRQMPQHGTVSAPRAHPRESNKVIVTYTHRAADAPLADSFTYACRLAGGAWSAPGTVTLTGQRMEPNLEVLSPPAFGKVFLGGQSSGRVAVRNTGTMDARVNLEWPEPWTGPPVLEVAKGGMAEFEVFFRPRRAGEFRHDVTIQAGVPSSRVIFYGECVPAFSVSPGSLVLELDPVTRQRVGTISVANTRPEAVRAVLKLPQRLQGPVEADVAANSKIDVRIFLPPADVSSFSGELVVQAGTDVQKVTLQAKATPPLMELVSPRNSELDFGTVDQRAVTSREVTVTNAGGEPLIVEARARPPFNVGGVVASMRIEPGGVGKLKVRLEPDRLGTVRGVLDLNASTSHAAVALTANVRESRPAPPAPAPEGGVPSAGPAVPTATPPPRPVPAPVAPPMDEEGGYVMRNPAQAAVMAIIAAKGLPSPGNVVNPYLEKVSPLELVESSPNSATIAFARPSLQPTGWTVEMATTVLSKEAGIFSKVWARHTKWQPVEAGNGKVGIRVGGLQPASQYEVHVMAVDREGKVSEPSQSLLIHTTEPWRVPSWVWRVLIAGGLSLVVYLLVRLRKGA